MKIKVHKSVYSKENNEVWRRVFVYGTLKLGEYNHERLGVRKEFVALGKIPGLELSMFITGVPVATPAREEEIFGEIWGVPEGQMRSLRTLEAAYTEIEVPVEILDEPTGPKSTICTTFVFPVKPDSELIPLRAGIYNSKIRAKAFTRYYDSLKNKD